PLSMRVTRAGADTHATAIARLVERAAAAKPRLVQAADRVGRALTGIVLVSAALAALAWRDVWVAVAILVATCPCAIALASPIVLTRAGSGLLRRGALLTRSQALETLGRVTDVVLDKTGTLTSGALSIRQTVLLGNESAARCASLAASLEATSRHPVARAFASFAAMEATAVKNHPGEGVEGAVAGKRLKIGSARFCGVPRQIEGERTVVYLADENGPLAAFVLEDPLR